MRSFKFITWLHAYLKKDMWCIIKVTIHLISGNQETCVMLKKIIVCCKKKRRHHILCLNMVKNKIKSRIKQICKYVKTVGNGVSTPSVETKAYQSKLTFIKNISQNKLHRKTKDYQHKAF